MDWIINKDRAALNTVASAFSSASDGVFGNCIGALDGISIKIKAPCKSNMIPDPGNYFCRKGFYALNVQAICDKHKQVLWMSTCHKGSTHDSVAFLETRLYKVLGDVIALSKDSWSAWTGGKPKADWTGLDPTAPGESTSPNQLRPVYVSAAQKGYNHRRTGMTTPFKPADDDLISFQNSIWDHLVDTGMDSIAYLPDPTDKTKVSNVVKLHSRYTVQSAKTLIQGQVELYKKYNEINDKAARTYLLASLTPFLLSNKVSEKLDDADPFPIAWLQFLKAIQSTSIERCEDLKTSIKLRLPSQYPGENLEPLAAQFRKDALELTTAGQYDHNLTLSMMKIFLLAGGSGNEDFCFPLRATKQKLEQVLLDIGFKEKTAANDHMSELKLTYKDVCAQAEDTYRTLYDRKEWPPARNVRDSKDPHAAFGHIAVECDTPLTRAEVMTLIQNKPRPAGSPTKKPGTCHKCGKPGHWASKCPDKPTGQRSQRNPPRNLRFPNNRNVSRKPGWHSTPPASGAPTTKKTDTHTFNRCATCKRWTTTHTTETHSGAPRNASASTSNPQTSAAMMSLVQDPSVWVTEVRRFPSFSDLLYAFSILPLLFFKIGLVIALLPLLGSFLWFVDTFIVIPVLLPILKFDLPVLVSTFQAATLPVSNIVTPIIQPIRSSSSQHLFSAGPLLPSSDGLSSAVSLVRDLTAPPSTQCHEPPSHRRAPSQSIRTEGLHRKYPLHLRSMVHFVRRSQAPTAEERRLRDEIFKIQIRVAALEREVRILSRLNYYDPTMVSPWPRQQCVPDVRREGGNHARQHPTGTPVRPHLQRKFPTVNWTDNRQNQGQQNRRTPAPVPDSTTSSSPRTFDVSNAYYRPTEPEFYGHHRHSAAHIAHVTPPPPSILERVALLAPSRFRSMINSNAAFPVI